jgi:nucleoside-triphosphatase THEP1/general stress protein 26
VTAPAGPGGARRTNARREAFADELLDAVTRRLPLSRGSPPSPVMVSGGVGAGKTEAGLRLAQRLRDAGVAVGGILAPRLVERGETVGYNVLDVSTGEDAAFARSDPPGEAVGRFFVRPTGLAFAERALRRGIERADVVLVDEVGRWELGGGGHAPALADLLRSRALPVLFVRTELAQAVADRFALQAAKVLRLTESVEREPAGGRRAFWSIVDSTPYPLFLTVASDGFPQSRPMSLIERDDHTLWFPTSRASRKIEQIRTHAQVTVLFVDTDRYNYASFHGPASLDLDRERARRLWRNEWRDDWPAGPDDADYALLRVDGARGFYLRGTTGEAGEIDLRGEAGP